MHTLSEIRAMLSEASLRPNRRFGQNFLVDLNLMRKLLALAGGGDDGTVLEVGPGTGSLTEELLDRYRHVVAVEIDRGFCELLRRRLAERTNLTLICGDVLAGKHQIAGNVLEALGPRAFLVANLPFNIATPLLAQCLVNSWRSVCGVQALCRIERMTFTVQQEVAQRLTAEPGGGSYGPVSVLCGLLGRLTPGPVIPATAYWPRPKVTGRILRINFDPQAAGKVADIDTLTRVLALAFSQRRKQIRSILKRKGSPFSPAALTEAFQTAGIDPTLRAQDVTPQQFLAMANRLA